MKNITKILCVVMALVVLVCSIDGVEASAAKRYYFAGDYRCKTSKYDYYVLQLDQYSSPEGKEVGTYKLWYLYKPTGMHPWGEGKILKTSQKNVYRLGKMKIKVYKNKLIVKNSEVDGVYKLKKRYPRP